MKWLVMLLMMCLLCTPAAAEEYQNPMTLEGQYGPFQSGADDYGIGDPFVLRHNGRYYLYASTCEERVKVWTSRDLINWTCEGYCTEGADVDFAYAPEVVYWRGSYYMITSPAGQGHYILKSDSPLGIFKPVTENFGFSIDGAFYKLDDGSLMMLYPDNWFIKTVMLEETTMLPAGESCDTGATLNHWTEGPGLFRRGDWYYLTFTGNHVCSTGYRVAFASRKGGAVGAYTQREDATILMNSVAGDSFQGLGHSASVIGPDLDSVYATYHSLVSLTGPARQYNLDRLLTNGGLLYSTGASSSAMPAPQMPDVWGDAADQLNDFVSTQEGFFAEIGKTDLFTQEWNFTLNGGTAQVIIGQRGDEDAVVSVSQTELSLCVGGEQMTQPLTEIGPQDCLHTLRVENTPDVLYLYVDDMRVMTVEQPGLTAARIGAYQTENVTYSFMACTAQALGSGDNEAVKRIPGVFSAIHALNADELAWEYAGEQEEKAPVLGAASYNVRVAEDGAYCFELCVRTGDAGRRVTLLLNDAALWTGEVPNIDSDETWFTFVTEPMELQAGDHILTIEADGVGLNTAEAFVYTPTEPLQLDFTDDAMREHYDALGNFVLKSSEGMLRTPGFKTAYALFGDEGNTDLALDVRFLIPEKGNGESGILLRATDVSLHNDQVKESFFGYSLSVSKQGVSLSRSRYGKVGEAVSAEISAWAQGGEAALHIELQGRKLNVYLPGEEQPLLTVEDAQPFAHGLYGFFSTGNELRILELTAAPLEGY